MTTLDGKTKRAFRECFSHSPLPVTARSLAILLFALASFMPEALRIVLSAFGVIFYRAVHWSSKEARPTSKQLNYPFKLRTVL